MSFFPNLLAGLPSNSYSELPFDDSTSWIQKAVLAHSTAHELGTFNAGFGQAIPGNLTGGEPIGFQRLSFLA